MTFPIASINNARFCLTFLILSNLCTYENSERAKTTRNDPKPAETTREVIEQPETTEDFEFGEV